MSRTFKLLILLNLFFVSACVDVVPEFSGVNHNKPARLTLLGPSHYDYEKLVGKCNSYEIQLENFYGNSVQIREGDQVNFELNLGLSEFSLYSDSSCNTQLPLNANLNYTFAFAVGEGRKQFYFSKKHSIYFFTLPLLRVVF